MNLSPSAPVIWPDAIDGFELWNPGQARLPRRLRRRRPRVGPDHQRRGSEVHRRRPGREDGRQERARSSSARRRSSTRRTSTSSTSRCRTPPSISARRAAAWSAGRFDGGVMALEECHRFPNRPVRLPDGLRWNLLHLFAEALSARCAAERSTASAWTPGASTTRCWTRTAACSACRSTTATSAPRASRASRATRSPASSTCRSTPSTSCWPTTAWARPSAIALVPDLLAYWLCGELANERTNASTTGLLDARTGEWSLRADRAARAAGRAVRRAGRAGHAARPGARAPRARRARLHRRLARHRVGLRRRRRCATSTRRSCRSGTWSLLGLELTRPCSATPR